MRARAWRDGGGGKARVRSFAQPDGPRSKLRSKQTDGSRFKLLHQLQFQSKGLESTRHISTVSSCIRSSLVAATNKTLLNGNISDVYSLV